MALAQFYEFPMKKKKEKNETKFKIYSVSTPFSQWCLTSDGVQNVVYVQAEKPYTIKGTERGLIGVKNLPIYWFFIIKRVNSSTFEYCVFCAMFASSRDLFSVASRAHSQNIVLIFVTKWYIKIFCAHINIFERWTMDEQILCD